MTTGRQSTRDRVLSRLRRRIAASPMARRVRLTPAEVDALAVDLAARTKRHRRIALRDICGRGVRVDSRPADWRPTLGRWQWARPHLAAGGGWHVQVPAEDTGEADRSGRPGRRDFPEHPTLTPAVDRHVLVAAPNAPALAGAAAC